MGARSRSRNTEKLHTGNYLDAQSVRFRSLPSESRSCKELAFTQRGELLHATSRGLSGRFPITQRNRSLSVYLDEIS